MEPSEKEEIRARTDIVALISTYTPLRQTGRNFKGLCPFHQEKTPSFTVDPEKGRWHCFGACSEGGDVFKFIEKAEGLTFPEAAERLAERAGIKLSRGNDPEAARRSDERDRLYAVNALAVRFFRETFARARLAQDYAAKRGLVHDTLEAFGIGFAPDDWSQLSDFLQRNAGGNTAAVMADAEKAGLVFPSRRGDGFTDKFRGRLMFPILDVQERVVAFGGRLLVPADNAPKYLNSPETPIFSKSRILYGLNRARKAIQEQDRVVVVEGYMDAVAAHQAGFEHVVATLGTSLTEEHIRLLGRYTKNVVLSFDADDAGVRAALRAASLFEAAGEGLTLRILALPPGEDPDSLLARGDAPRFRKAIETALSVPEFRLRSLETRYDLKTEEGRLALLREALPVLGEASSATERDRLLLRLAPLHPAYNSGGGRAEQTLRDELDAYLKRNGARGEPPLFSGPPVHLRGENVLQPGKRGGPAAYGRGAPRRWGAPVPAATEQLAPPRQTAAQAAEHVLLCALLSDEFCPLVRNDLQPEDFVDPQTVRLLDALLPLLSGGYAPSDALAQLVDDHLVEHAQLLTMRPDEEPLSAEVIADCLKVLEDNKRRHKIREIQAQVAPGGEGMPTPDDEQLRRWYQESRALKGAKPSADGRDGGSR